MPTVPRTEPVRVAATEGTASVARGLAASAGVAERSEAQSAAAESAQPRRRAGELELSSRALGSADAAAARRLREEELRRSAGAAPPPTLSGQSVAIADEERVCSASSGGEWNLAQRCACESARAARARLERPAKSSVLRVPAVRVCTSHGLVTASGPPHRVRCNRSPRHAPNVLSPLLSCASGACLPLFTAALFFSQTRLWVSSRQRAPSLLQRTPASPASNRNTASL